MNKQHLINHVNLILDGSGSIGPIKHELGKMADATIEHLAQLSKSMDQETRVSVYKFSDDVENMYYDIDCLRLPKIGTDFYIGHNTALIAATLKGISDLKQTAQLYGDHSFLFYVLTDGQNNKNSDRSNELLRTIESLPENWTLAGLVPDEQALRASSYVGFPQNNLKIWSTTDKGVKEVGEVVRQTTQSYMTGRSQGIRGTKNLFSLNTQNLTTNKVKTSLEELKSSEYHLLRVSKETVIKPFIESWKINFVPGGNYYELMKSELIQPYKQILVKNKINGKLYGGTNARQILGLPDYEVKVNPADSPDYKIFCQSSSVNRKLIAGTELIVLK